MTPPKQLILGPENENVTPPDETSPRPIGTQRESCAKQNGLLLFYFFPAI